MKRPVIFLMLISIISLGALFRFHGLNWDQGFHMHPDERAITLFTIQLQFPHSFNEFISPQSPWNPNFFAYGSLPLYLLWILGHILAFINPLFAQYEKINLIGRGISACFDVGTIILIYFLGKKIFGERVGLLGAFFYALSVLPMQLSHFYAVDTLLTFFITATLLALISLYERPSIRSAVLVGLLFGLSLATKISATVLIIAVGITIGSDFLLIFLRAPHRVRVWLPHLPRFLKRILTEGITICVVTLVTFLLCEPYALLDFPKFLSQTQEQSAMTKSAFTFPYTLQYVGKIPYFYELKNVFLFGLGPALGILAFIGILFGTVLIWQKKHDQKWGSDLLLIIFFWSYFLIVGNFAVGFMRYMLPLYPLFCLFAALLMQKILLALKAFLKNRLLFFVTCYLLLVSLLIWPICFSQIYRQPNTRVTATAFIQTQIPAGKTIALEHWDDALPLLGQEQYHMLTLPLYDPDTKEKWTAINQGLKQADYIILASNRLYVPLQKLTDCKNLPVGKCYKTTASYYRQLFSGGNVIIDGTGSARFKKIADISDSPTIPFTNIVLTDQSADESFTVYDHPRIMIFKKQ